MKQHDFENYSNSELKEIKKNLAFYYDDTDVSWNNLFGKIMITHHPIVINDERFHVLPEKIKTYITTPNKESGNVHSRKIRCIQLINQEIIKRF